jgi:hypothetical protein
MAVIYGKSILEKVVPLQWNYGIMFVKQNYSKELTSDSNSIYLNIYLSLRKI